MQAVQFLFLPKFKGMQNRMFGTAPFREKTVKKKGQGMTSTKCRVVIASRREGEGVREEGRGARFRNVSCQLLEAEGGYLNS